MSQLSDECDAAMKSGGKGRVFDILRRRGPVRPPDPDLDAWIRKTYDDPANPGTMTDDCWLAMRLAALGAEPRWPLADLQERQRRANAPGRAWAAEPGGIEADLAAAGVSFRALYFPGTTARRAMIISGVHGDELAGVEVVETLLPMLKTAKRSFSLMVVPRVFAKNCAAKRRKTSDKHTDPNRQMPKVGDPPAPTFGKSGKPVEPENQALLELIQRFQPERLLSVHGVGSGDKRAGITSDPRASFKAADEQLALDMAKAAKAAGASVPGNSLGSGKPVATYPTQQVAHEDGVTLGQWGSAAAGPRPAINMILIETNGKPATGNPGGPPAKERDALVKAVLDVFLAP
ncbi:hypothetical protein [Muricoccus radiodurans]|uniref:hypothetical protein n=1 Tax=Muricoccus radiodurans TaxID=2231721 RepID=UPI003CF704E0